MSLLQRFAVAAVDQLATATPCFQVVTRHTGGVEPQRALRGVYQGGSR